MANRIVEMLVRLKDDASAGLKHLDDGVSKLAQGYERLVGIIKAFVVTWIGEKLVGALVRAISVFAEYEQSVVKLNAALEITGRFSEEGSRKIQEMARHIQNVTETSRASAIHVSALAAAFTQTLTVEQIADLQKAAVGFAEVFGGGVEHAATLFVRAMEGSAVVLRRYGIDIDGAMSEQERFQAIMQRFGPLFGVAREAADTLAGRVEQLKNEFADLQRAVGDALTRILGLHSGIGTTKSLVQGATDWIRAHGEQIVGYGQKFVFVLVELIKMIPLMVRVAIDEVKRFLEQSPVIQFMRDVRDLWRELNQGLQNLIDNIRFDETFEGVDFTVTADTTEADERLSEFEKRWEQIKKRLAEPVSTGAIALGDATNVPAPGKLPRAGGSAESPTATTTRLTGAVKDLNDQLAQGEIAYDLYTSASTDAQRAIAFEIAWLKERIRTGAVVGKELGSTRELITQLQTAWLDAGSKIPPEMERLVQQYKALKAAVDAQTISEIEFRTEMAKLDPELDAWIKQLEELAKSGDLSEQALRNVMRAMRDLQALAGDSAASTLKFGETLRDAFLGSREPINDARKGVQNMATALGENFFQAVGAAAFASENFGKAVLKGLAEAAKGEAIMAIAKMFMELAAAFATPIPNLKRDHLAAAAFYAKAAAVFGAVGALAGAAGGGGGGGGGGAGGARERERALEREKGPGTIVIEGTPLASDPKFLEELNTAISELDDRRIRIIHKPGR